MITIKDVIRKSDLLQCLKHVKNVLVNLFGFFYETGKVELLTQFSQLLHVLTDSRWASATGRVVKTRNVCDAKAKKDCGKQLVD